MSVCLNSLTANDALPNYPSTAKAVNAVTYVKRYISCVRPYDLPQGCSGKLPGTVLQPWGLCFGTWVNILGCRKYQTGNQCTKPLLHPLGREKAYCRGFLLLERIYTPVAVRGNLLVAVRGLTLEGDKGNIDDVYINRFPASIAQQKQVETSVTISRQLRL